MKVITQRLYGFFLVSAGLATFAITCATGICAFRGATDYYKDWGEFRLALYHATLQARHDDWTPDPIVTTPKSVDISGLDAQGQKDVMDAAAIAAQVQANVGKRRR